MREQTKTVSGNIVDVLNARIFPGMLKISHGRIAAIIPTNDSYPTYLVPGLVDSHIHLESSLLPPSEFARIAVVHGTVAAVSDPHEIANVLGIRGVQYMIEDAKAVPMKCYFGAPSCVPATPFETAGASLGPEEVEYLLRLNEVKFLGEVMNFPGVINGDPDLIKKIQCAQNHSKPIDGHAPGLRGNDLKKYIHAGISTDHECLTKEEALEKITLGMKIHIREGSAAKNFEELIPLAEKNYKSCMLCSDDKHPDDLIESHINGLVKKALHYGIDRMKVLTIASVNPVLHYGLNVGLLQVGDYADFIEVDNLKDFTILRTYINGAIVSENGQSLLPQKSARIINHFNVTPKKITDFSLPSKEGNLNVIEAIDGQLLTNRLVVPPKVINGFVESDVERDILKIAVVNRYQDTKVSVGFIKNFGLKQGAIASSVAHDSHNIISVGVSDVEICRAVNLIIEHKGGICAVSEDIKNVLPLPIAGLMSNEDYAQVARKYRDIDNIAKTFGSTLRAPLTTLSFMSLPVIPKLKLSAQGLFDGEKFKFIDIFEK